MVISPCLGRQMIWFSPRYLSVRMISRLSVQVIWLFPLCLDISSPNYLYVQIIIWFSLPSRCTNMAFFLLFRCTYMVLSPGPRCIFSSPSIFGVCTARLTCRRSRSLVSCRSSWLTTCICTLACAVDLSSSVCSVLRCLWEEERKWRWAAVHCSVDASYIQIVANIWFCLRKWS